MPRLPKSWMPFPSVELLVPAAVLGSLGVLFFHLPGPVMDGLLSLNLSLSVIIFLTVFFVKKPTDLSVFPTLLLATTLFRLVLNVATTRLILTQADALGDKAAGEVIGAFARFVSGDNLVVGIVMFSIFVVIQFVVITKGATRISEVAARFVLDALPGRQMAIDADLSAGHINEKQARRLRADLTESSDFFGAMDGAGKFVRGDAVASLLIIGVNIVGGILIGTLQNGRPILETLTIYTRLTVGDGLVAQVPALLISLATGILVSRQSRATNLSKLLTKQLSAYPAVFGLGGGFLVVLMFTGLPVPPLAILAAGAFFLAFFLSRRNEMRRLASRQKGELLRQAERKAEEKTRQEKIENYLTVDPMVLQIGVGLVRLIQPQDSGMMGRIRRLREEVAAELGILLPPIRIQDNLSLEENRYQILIGGETVAEGVIRPGMILAVDVERNSSPLPGVKVTDPVTGSTAWWIEPALREKGEIFGFLVRNADEALFAHLKETALREAALLLTRDTVATLVAHLKTTSPAVVNELIPDVMKLGGVQNVLRRLLAERVSIRPLATILESLGDSATRTQHPVLLTEGVRAHLGRTICRRLRDEEGRMNAIFLDPVFEESVRGAMTLGDESIRTALDPLEIDDFLRRLEATCAEASPHAVLVVAPEIRPAVRELIKTKFPRLAVLSFAEIPADTQVVTVGILRRISRAA